MLTLFSDSFILFTSLITFLLMYNESFWIICIFLFFFYISFQYILYWFYYTNASVKTCYVHWAIDYDVCLLLKHWLMSVNVFTHFIKLSCNEYSVYVRFMVILLFRTWNQLYVDLIICIWFFVVHGNKCVYVFLTCSISNWLFLTSWIYGMYDE
jgi:hypothetical protein